MKKILKVIKYIFLILITAVFLFPVVYMIACSFMSDSQVSSMLDFTNGEYKEINLIPEMFSLEQYYQVLFRRPEYLLKFWNSVIITFTLVLKRGISSY